MVLRRPKAGTFNNPAGLKDFVEGCRVKRVKDGSQVSPPGTVTGIIEDEKGFTMLEIEWDYNYHNGDHESFTEAIEEGSVERLAYTCSECDERRPIEYTAPISDDNQDSFSTRIKCTGCCETTEDAEHIWRY